MTLKEAVESKHPFRPKGSEMWLILTHEFDEKNGAIAVLKLKNTKLITWNTVPVGLAISDEWEIQEGVNL